MTPRDADTEKPTGDAAELTTAGVDPGAPTAEARPKRLVLCLDGTWNSPATRHQRDDGDDVFKPTNVLKTARAVRDLDDVTATLVLDGLPRDGESLLVAGRRYRFRDILDDHGDDHGDDHRDDFRVEGTEVAVQIGADIGESLENLRHALAARAGRKRRFSRGATPHPSVRARRVAGDRRSLEIIAWGTAADSDAFATASDLARGRWIDKRELADEYRRRGLDPHRGIPQIAYYDLGVGGSRRFRGISNRVHRVVDRAFGGAAGAGFEATLEAAYQFLSSNYRPGDEIFLFGFSRGAAAARGLSRFIDWMGGVLPPRDAYWIPRYFDAFLAGGSLADTRAAIRREARRSGRKRGLTAADAERRAERIVGVVTPARVRFLGVWDTVLSLGGRRERPHHGPSPAAIVDHARQALAIDERRPDFLPRIWSHAAADRPEQTLKQRWFAGVHTNIGGGYVYDGLANLALEWMLREARDVGLSVDWGFLRRYSGYPQDRLYDSSALPWRILQTLTLRRGVGGRQLRVDPEAGLHFHPSVFHRLAASRRGGEARHPRLARYRPKNLLRFLNGVADLDAFLAELDLGEAYELPRDVARSIG